MRKRFKKAILSFLFLASAQLLLAQNFQNWHWKDYNTDTIHGISLHKAYQLLATLPQKPSPIIVAVIDGGIDTNHIALHNLLWTNTKEIPNNGIDDDHNGYVDDVHGWNFIGGKDGRNINKASDEKSRIYHQFKNKFENKAIDTNTLNTLDKRNYIIWKQTENEIQVSENDLANVQYVKMATNALRKMGGILLKEITDSNFTVLQLESFQPVGRVTLETKMAYLRTIKILGIESESTYPEIMSDLEEYVEGKEKAANAKLNAPAPIREDIIKDQYENFADKYYGNNDITGPNAKHGTHVAGLVASIPDSSWNVFKLYPAISIMGVRTVPDGDEYDKDVALAIRYAVDNGAKIINMSFGKSYSPQQAWVDSAIRYAAQKDVLLVHSAGNEFYNLDIKSVYPSAYSTTFMDTAQNVITIGASSDEKINGSLLTDFSNFGTKTVDVLSPGNKIYSTLPGKTNYGYLQGTSMSSPIVSHIAAMIRSYYPQLSAIQVKQILMNSAWKPEDTNRKYTVPNRETEKTLLEVTKTGGIVNAANALALAQIIKPINTNSAEKKKSKKN
ncbi:MAG: peptidase S8 [Chitinophagaceae bacterium]|nr:MAG: peptidase S8 [Chitinophagaceae bacterium]